MGVVYNDLSKSQGPNNSLSVGSMGTVEEHKDQFGNQFKNYFKADLLQVKKPFYLQRIIFDFCSASLVRHLPGVTTRLLTSTAGSALAKTHSQQRSINTFITLSLFCLHSSTLVSMLTN